MEIKFFQEDGNKVYLGFLIPVKRGIKNKNKPIVDELLVLGFNKSKKPELYQKIKEVVEQNACLQKWKRNLLFQSMY